MRSALLLIGLLAAIPPAQARAAAVAPEVDEAARKGGLVPVIVTLTEDLDLKTLAAQPRTEVVRRLKAREAELEPLRRDLDRLGAIRQTRLWLIKGIATRLPAPQIRRLAEIPGVAAIRLDATVPAPTVIYAATGLAEWNIAAIRAPDLWNLGVTGRDAVVAVLDTGVDGVHPDLKARWRGGSNSWFDPYGQHAQPTDMNGHGTHVAGLTVGGAAGGTAIGVAPDARWIAAKAFDDNGYGTLSGLHLAFQWTLDPDGDPATRDAPDVVNASWGLMGGAGQCNGEFQPDIDALRAAGIVVVFSAGNDGPNSGTSQSPGNNAGALAVGALDSAMTVPGFSSRGPSACDGGLYPALAAPGVAVKTPDLSYGGIFPDAYALVTGTSFSAPHVSGAVALLASAVPWATPDQIGNALKQSAQDAGAAGPDNQSGQGLIDVAAAYALIKNLPPPDGDGDGHPVATDCDDANAAIHPGAAEIRSDGIDQDCNGYDLTITIVTSSYSSSAKKLTVEATSALKQAAGLKLDGYGPMSWDTKKQRWVITVTGVAVKPAHVTVSGIEGSVTR